MQRYWLIASGIALDVSESPDKLSQLTGCQLAKDGEEGCRSKLSAFVLTQLFRGLGDADAPAELEQLFDQGQELGGDCGVRAVLEVALQSPEFLYHFELGRPAAGRGLTWHEPTDLEMASRLSFMLWDRGPDDELLAAGENGELSEPAELEAQARRLLQDERARQPVRRFYRELLGAGGETSLNPTVYPDFTPAVQQLMGRELDAFVDDATFAGAGDYRALFEPVTWLNQPLAEFTAFRG